ncbi:MAG: glycosyltransferase family 4 protein [Faecousia sp.]
MRIVFASNFMNHHQMPLAKAFSNMEDVEFTFVAAEPVPAERRKLGYHDMNHAAPFILCAYESEEAHRRAVKLCEDCDVLIYGSAPGEFYRHRQRKGKLTFRYSERVYKKPCPRYEIPLRAVCYFFRYTLCRKLYLLCASAYTAGDYRKTGTFRSRAYKWGYFPEVTEYADLSTLMAQKKPASLLWAGRLIDWKHPEAAILAAKKLKESGCSFSLDIIGTGEMEAKLRAMIAKAGLEEQVHLLGSMPPEQVRRHMETSEIFLLTSDRNEGWGAVLNEAMNSGCAVVASHAVGSVPFLIHHKENGLIYRDGDTDMLFRRIQWLLEHPAEREDLGKRAYDTLREDWNPEMAVSRLVSLSRAILNGERRPRLFDSGVCSQAEPIPEEWLEET